jgi:hypothetical protein
MLTILEQMEQRARESGPQLRLFTSCDTLDVIFHADWVEGTQFVYHHNGVRIDRQRARELVPGYENDYEED